MSTGVPPSVLFLCFPRHGIGMDPENPELQPLALVLRLRSVANTRSSEATLSRRWWLVSQGVLCVLLFVIDEWFVQYNRNKQKINFVIVIHFYYRNYCIYYIIVYERRD
jgi:hypothetical protein